ncbi:hypothetical protein Tco_0977581 [Tanacetum coccineum]|uniref:Uncharacterized protein n=1 Tax=Tanacetum coccineum TaxID=301880 RepID=A0ABQ5EKI9_9ASTR
MKVLGGGRCDGRGGRGGSGGGLIHLGGKSSRVFKYGCGEVGGVMKTSSRGSRVVGGVEWVEVDCNMELVRARSCSPGHYLLDFEIEIGMKKRMRKLVDEAFSSQS